MDITSIDQVHAIIESLYVKETEAIAKKYGVQIRYE